MNVDVLVVEDAPEFARIVSTVLESAGHRVRLATTIAEALAEMDVQVPDVVILDLGLPDGDGLDLCRMIRERSSAYVLMLTGRRSFAKVPIRSWWFWKKTVMVKIFILII